ncbi:DMT family transporter (plasmid) [Nitrobacteraceae bacterium UC4446_H13]
MNQYVQGVIYATICVILFASFVLISRAGLSTSLTLPDIAALRFGIGAIVLLPLIIRYGFSSLRFRQIILISALGGLGFALFAYSGFALAPASHGGVLIHGTLALTTALLISCFGLRPSRTGQGVGLIIIAAGVVAMAWDGTTMAGDWMPAGDACLLGASLCWSGYGLYVKRLEISAFQAAAIVAATSAIIFLPIYLVLPGKMLPHAEWRDVLLQAIFQGALIGAGSIFVYTRAVVLLGPERVAFFTAAVPSLAVAGGYVFLDEVPGIAAMIGAVLVTIGMVAALRGQPASTHALGE